MNVKIGLAGDVMIGRQVNEFLKQTEKNPSYVWGDLLNLLKSNDLNFINLETTLTTSTVVVPKTFNFRAAPHLVEALTEGTIDGVNVANNHILDFSEEGLLETLNVLNEAAIFHVGAGKNIAEARAPFIWTGRELTVGFMGCTDNEAGWIAKENKPGIHFIKVGDSDIIKEDIALIRDRVDILILSIHWGPNMREKPAQAFIDFAHQMIDAGVDILHGHSAHIFQGVEIYKGKVILYDTGDFIDDYYVDPVLRNDRSFYFVAEVNRNGIDSLRLIPVLISNYQVNRAVGDEARAIINRMVELSKPFNTSFKIDNDLSLYLLKEN